MAIEDTRYKVAVWTLGVTAVLSILAILVAVGIYLHVAIKLKGQQLVGRRFEQECGKEVTERETERYYVYNAFEEGKLNRKLVASIILIRSSMALILTGILIAYTLWMTVVFSGSGFTSYKLYIFWYGFCTFMILQFAFLVGTGVMGAIVRAVGTSKYRVKMLSTDVEKSVSEVFKDLDFISKAKLNNPWYAMGFVIFYSLLLYWFTKYTNYKEKVDKQGILWAVLVIFLYFFSMAVATWMDKDIRKLFANINGLYVAYKTSLQTNIQNLFTRTGSTPKQTRQYFKTWIETVLPKTEVHAESIRRDANNRGEWDQQLWKFIQHRGGKEMEEIYDSGDATTKTTIDEIRKWALNMRMMSKPIRTATNKCCRNAIVAGMVIIVSVAFALFNFISRASSTTNTMIAALLITLVFVVVSTWFGWFSSALML